MPCCAARSALADDLEDDARARSRSCRDDPATTDTLEQLDCDAARRAKPTLELHRARCRSGCNYLGPLDAQRPDRRSPRATRPAPGSARSSSPTRDEVTLGGRARARPARQPLPARGAGQDGECEAGNEPYAARASRSATRRATRARTTEETRPPDGGGQPDEARRASATAAAGSSDFAVGLAGDRRRVLRVLARVRRRCRGSDDYELKAVVASGARAAARARRCGSPASRSARSRRSSAAPGNTAIVTMAIEETALPIHKDATLKVRPRIFLEGNFFVDLQPGTPQLADGRRGRHDPARADRGRRCSSTRSCRRSRATRATTSSCCSTGCGDGARRTAAREALHERAASTRTPAFTQRRARRRGGARHGATTTCPVHRRRRRRRRRRSRAATSSSPS